MEYLFKLEFALTKIEEKRLYQGGRLVWFICKERKRVTMKGLCERGEKHYAAEDRELAGSKEEMSVPKASRSSLFAVTKTLVR